MKVCVELNIPFVIPSFIIQDASHAEANAALSVFGPSIQIIMCWFHLIFNVKKHESLTKVKQELREMVLTDLTNPMESFNKIIKALFTNYDEQPLMHFIRIIIDHLIPFYSTNTKEFLFYRVPGKKTIALGKTFDTEKIRID